MANRTIIRMLEEGDVDAYVAHLAIQCRESGTGGELPYGPDSRDAQEKPGDMRDKALTRWATPLDVPAWRRAWGAFDAGGRLVGSVYLAGGEIPTGLHRVDCGIGIERPHRGKGLGRRLMETAIDWARGQAGIDWIDLGVFEGNDAAEGLYQSLGFVECGRIPDRFRVDGHVINDILMALSVSNARAVTAGEETAP